MGKGREEKGGARGVIELRSRSEDLWLQWCVWGITEVAQVWQ
jgi:hypothetical protein